MKTCSRCKKELPADSFTASDCYCRPCRKEVSYAWNRTHRDRASAATRRWQKKNAARCRKSMDAWRKANPDKVRTMYDRWYNSGKGKLWRQKYREKKNAQAKEWRNNNPEKRRAIKRQNYSRHAPRLRAIAREKRFTNIRRYKKRERESRLRNREKNILISGEIRARRAGAEGHHTIAEWKSVLRHYHRRCFYCGIPLTVKNVSKDHRNPLSRGGSNDIRNIVPCCRPCNSSKHNKRPEEFVAARQLTVN